MIALAGIQQMDLLNSLYSRVCIPIQVHAELTGSRRFAAQSGLFSRPWIEVVSLSVPLDPFLSSQMDSGEAAVLTLARQIQDSEVLLDERRGRPVAEQVYGLRIVDTGGLLLCAKTAGLIGAVKPLLTEMRNNG